MASVCGGHHRGRRRPWAPLQHDDLEEGRMPTPPPWFGSCRTRPADTSGSGVSHLTLNRGPTMTDPTEDIRRHLLAGINATPGSREYLEHRHGQVWDTDQ